MNFYNALKVTEGHDVGGYMPDFVTSRMVQWLADFDVIISRRGCEWYVTAKDDYRKHGQSLNEVLASLVLEIAVGGRRQIPYHFNKDKHYGESVSGPV